MLLILLKSRKTSQHKNKIFPKFEEIHFRSIFKNPIPDPKTEIDAKTNNFDANSFFNVLCKK